MDNYKKLAKMLYDASSFAKIPKEDLSAMYDVVLAEDGIECSKLFDAVCYLIDDLKLKGYKKDLFLDTFDKFIEDLMEG